MAAGHDVLRAALEHPTLEDADVLARAVQEGRILITYDRDFSELIFAGAAKQPPAIIYIRYEPENVADVLPRLMPLLDFTKLDGHMTVIGKRHSRRTPLPLKSDNDA